MKSRKYIKSKRKAYNQKVCIFNATTKDKNLENTLLNNINVGYTL